MVDPLQHKTSKKTPFSEVQQTDLPKLKRKWTAIYALEEVFTVIEQSQLKKSEILVSLDLEGIITSRCSKETHHDPLERCGDEDGVQAGAVQFLEQLDECGVAWFIHKAPANTYLTSHDHEFIHPEYSLLSAGCSKDIDEALTHTIKLVLHVDDSFVHIFDVLIALYRFPAVCIHGLFLPTAEDDQVEWTTQMTHHKQFLLDSEAAFSKTCGFVGDL